MATSSNQDRRRALRPRDAIPEIRNAGAMMARGHGREAVALYRRAATLYELDGFLRQAIGVLAAAWRALESRLPRDAEDFVLLALELARLQSELGFHAEGQAVLRRSRAWIAASGVDRAAIDAAGRLEPRAEDHPASMIAMADALRIAGLYREAAQSYLRGMQMSAREDGKHIAHAGNGLLAVGAPLPERTAAARLLHGRTRLDRIEERLLRRLETAAPQFSAGASLTAFPGDALVPQAPLVRHV